MKVISKRANGSTRVVSVPDGKSKTQQQFKDQVNVNQIIKKYKATGSVTHVRNQAEGVYADLVNLPDYQEALNITIHAKNTFAAMPAEIRNRFNHDPQLLINFLADEKNLDDAIKLGLKKPKPQPQPDPILAELKNLNQNLKPNQNQNT